MSNQNKDAFISQKPQMPFIIVFRFLIKIFAIWSVEFIYITFFDLSLSELNPENVSKNSTLVHMFLGYYDCN